MKRIHIVSIACACAFSATLCLGQSYAPIMQWDRRFGGSAFETLRSVQQTTDGGYLLAGHSSSGISGDRTWSSRGSYDYWIVKLNSSGAKQWDRRFGGTGGDFCGGAQQASDGGYLIAGYSLSGIGGDKTEANNGTRDYWIVKINSSGAKLWDKRYGGPASDYCTVVRRTSDGGYIIAGYSNSGAGGDKSQTSRGGFDYWVVRVNSNGGKLWDRRFGGSQDEYCYDILQTPDGGFILFGDSASGATGDKSQASRGGSDYWMVKLDQWGTRQWDRRFGGAGNEWASSIHRTSDGGFILGGWSFSGAGGDKTEGLQGICDYWIVKTDSLGTKQWDKRFGGSGHDYLQTVRQTTDGGYILAGESLSGAVGDKTQASRGSTDFWLVKTDALGNKQWDRRYGGSAGEYCYSAQQTSDGGFVLAGNSRSGISGDKTEGLRGESDYWIVKLGVPTPTVQRFDTTQPVAGHAANRWSFMTAWNLTTDAFEVSPGWYNGVYAWDHEADQYQEWIARFAYDQAAMQTRRLAWYYRQIHVQ